MDRAAQFLLYAVMLALPLSASIARRPPAGQAAKMALAWIAIFGVAMVAFGLRGSLPSADALFHDQEVVGAETRITMDPDGHFYARVAVNGVERRMLVDSGATMTALSQATARAVGIQVDAGLPVMIDTANGTVEARRGTAATVRLGSINATDLRLVTSPAFGDTDVLGMNFLSRLGSWRVEGRTLVLTPEKPS